MKIKFLQFPGARGNAPADTGLGDASGIGFLGIQDIYRGLGNRMPCTALHGSPDLDIRVDHCESRLNGMPNYYLSWQDAGKERLFVLFLTRQKGVLMLTDTEIKLNGVQALIATLGKVDAERFIALIQRGPFDYTKWQRNLWDYQGVEEISRNAMRCRKLRAEQKK